MKKSTVKKTTEEFKKEVTEKFGNKFILDKVVYVNSHTPVCVICPEHGEFWVSPTNLLFRGKCPKCKHQYREKLKNDFIEKSIKLYGDKYGYSKVEYVNSHTKVCVICPKHGEFWVAPTNFLNNQDCLKCKREKYLIEHCKKDYEVLEKTDKTITLFCEKHGRFEISLIKFKTKKYTCPKCLLENNISSFIKKANKIHNNKYTYDESTFVNNIKKMRIICSIHGEFWQTPNNHLNGQGCKKCSDANKTKTKEQFIQDVIRIHGNKYDYSKVQYVNGHTKVCVICPIHGEFWATPNQLLSGKGCAKCSKYRNRYTTETIIEKFKEIHGDKYDYTKVKYINAKTKVCIVCPIHGEFYTTPNKHLQGRGCPKCNYSHGENDINLLLKKHNINFTYNNRNVLNKLELDFFIEDIKIAIECQGKQHFFPSTWYGSDNIDNETQEIVKRDIQKNHECKEKNITLIYYIPNKIETNMFVNPKFSNIYNKNNCFFTIDELEKFLTKIKN